MSGGYAETMYRWAICQIWLPGVAETGFVILQVFRQSLNEPSSQKGQSILSKSAGLKVDLNIGDKLSHRISRFNQQELGTLVIK